MNTPLNARTAACPACGNHLVFKTGAGRVVVCDYCGYAVARTDVGLSGLGKVADLVPTGAKLCLGASGSWHGRRFVIVGRQQIRWEQGAWDEWFISLADGDSAWLSEDDGRYMVSQPMHLGVSPRWSGIAVGRSIFLGKAGRFVVTEKRTGTYVSGQGTLPDGFVPGGQYNYADLSSSSGRYATLDFSHGDVPVIYLGEEVPFADLHIELPADAQQIVESQPSVDASAMVCPKCNAPLSLHFPGKATQLTCEHCGGLVGISEGRLKFLQAMPKGEPARFLSKKCTFEGEEYLTIGWMRRGGTDSDGEHFSWEEYLLYSEATTAYAFLCVDDNGHWSLSRPIPPLDGVLGDISDFADFEGERYKIFARDEAVIEAIQGEFFWQARVGDRALCSDFIAPPLGLSCEIESDGQEVSWAKERYLTPQEVLAAYGDSGELDEPSGIGALQPSKWKEVSSSCLKWGFIYSIAAIVIYAVLCMMAPSKPLISTVIERSFVPGGAKSSTETYADLMAQGIASSQDNSEMDALSNSAVTLSDPFTIEGRYNLELKLSVSPKAVDQSWAGVSPTLINETTNETFSLGDAELSYYSGYDDGPWTEDETNKSVYRGTVPPGNYLLRLDTYWDKTKGANPPRIRAELIQGSPRMMTLVVFCLLLWVIPLLFVFLDSSFEGQRWADSDFGSSEDDDDDDDDDDD